jgi:uncharacterized protein DUF222/HNH endonuclease
MFMVEAVSNRLCRTLGLGLFHDHDSAYGGETTSGLELVNAAIDSYRTARCCQRRDGCRPLLDSGAPAQLIIMLSAEQLRDRTGYAETSFGQLISVPEALRLAGEADLALMFCDGKGAVLAEHRTKRIATRSQTLALIARDRGCSFPDCDRPPEWTQRHHILAWQDGGATDLDNLPLLCHQHHRRFEAEGWRCVMKDGLPCWIPPPWIDPAQHPRQNHRIRRR